MLLVKDTDVIRVITSTTADIDSHASYVDYNSGTGALIPDRKNTKINTAATTSVVVSPASGVIRNVQDLFVTNVHASTSNQVTIQHYDGTNAVQLESVLLLAGERIAIRDGVPTRLIDALGMEKTNANAAVYVKPLASDLTNATTTAAKVTGLDYTMGVGTWIFEYVILWRSDTTTTGVKFGCNHTGTVSFFCYDMYGTTADITTNTSVMDQDVLLTTGATMSAWAARAKSVTAPMIAAGVDTVNLDQMMLITGIAVVTAGGNIELYHASEAATTTTVKAQSALRLTKVS